MKHDGDKWRAVKPDGSDDLILKRILVGFLPGSQRLRTARPFHHVRMLESSVLNICPQHGALRVELFHAYPEQDGKQKPDQWVPFNGVETLVKAPQDESVGAIMAARNTKIKQLLKHIYSLNPIRPDKRTDDIIRFIPFSARGSLLRYLE